MKKKYSDPLMFSSVLLDEIDIPPSGGEGGIAPDQARGSKSRSISKLTVNEMPGTAGSAEDVKIVSPVEEPMVGISENPVESAGAVETPVIPEAASVIDNLVEEEASSAGTITSAPAE